MRFTEITKSGQKITEKYGNEEFEFFVQTNYPEMNYTLTFPTSETAEARDFSQVDMLILQYISRSLWKNAPQCDSAHLEDNELMQMIQYVRQKQSRKDFFKYYIAQSVTPTLFTKIGKLLGGLEDFYPDSETKLKFIDLFNEIGEL